MKATYISVFGITALLAMLAGAAVAKDTISAGVSSVTPLDRAQVKSEARAAEQAGTIPRGQLSTPSPASSGAAVDRTARKAETSAYMKVKQATWAPNTGIYNQGNSSKSVASRADIKAQTLAAQQNQEIPRGEAQSRTAPQW